MRYLAVAVLASAATYFVIGGGGPALPDVSGGDAFSEPKDEDGDGIPDSWEEEGQTPDGTPLPGADPGQKDIYLQIYRSPDVDPLSGAEINELKTYWGLMELEAEGVTESGVNLHIVHRSELEEQVTIDGSSRSFERLYRDRFAERMPENCVYHTVVLADLSGDYAAGRAQSPGYFAVADGARIEGRPDYRVTTITHELLHNVVGEIDGSYHTENGFLSEEYGDSTLSDAVEAKLNEEGFATTDAVSGCSEP
jgi:hypothetical protein